MTSLGHRYTAVELVGVGLTDIGLTTVGLTDVVLTNVGLPVSINLNVLRSLSRYCSLDMALLFEI